MNKKGVLEQLLERVTALPEQAQGELTDFVIGIEAKYTGSYHVTDEERAAIERGLRDVREGRVKSEAEMEEFWKQHGV